MLRFVLVLVLAQVFSSYGQTDVCVAKNVCKNLEDYWTIQQNPNCWYSYDVGASVSQIIIRYGYVFESYKVTTEDGYILTLFRVPHNGTLIYGRPPVLLHHGFAADASSWLNLGIDSLVFQLSNSGYDVWIANSRGTQYSSEHIRYTIYSREYWDFGLHEKAIYDLPAMIDFITSKTGQRGQITYIGHSTGTTISYIYSSVKSTHAVANIKSIISLGPVAYMGHTVSLFKTLSPYIDMIWSAFSFMGIYGIGPNIQYQLDSIHRYCSQVPSIYFCANIHSWLYGYSQTEIFAQSFPIAFNKFPAGISFRELAHYSQLIRAQSRFQYYDFGESKNIQLYNCVSPPEYDLSLIRVPVYLYFGKKDTLAVEEDVVYLYNRLTSLTVTQKSILETFNFAHYNFLAAKDSKMFHQIVVDKVKKCYY